mgnify:CR=1 FL=1|tara:strand:+ start:587 stop:1282 length:696 start_codon:yes stop_codon:yes gene_type:complete
MAFKMKGSPMHSGTAAHKSALKHMITDKDNTKRDQHNSKHTSDPSFDHEKNKKEEEIDYKGDVESPTKQIDIKKGLEKAAEYTFNPGKGILDLHNYLTKKDKKDKKGSKGASGISKKAGEALKDAATRKKMKEVETKRREEELKKIKEKKRRIKRKETKKRKPITREDDVLHKEIIDYKDDIKKKKEKDLNSNTPKSEPLGPDGTPKSKLKSKKKESTQTKEEVENMPKGA